jgi:hypothetical protein
MMEKHYQKQLWNAELKIVATQNFLVAVVYQAAVVGPVLGMIISHQGLFWQWDQAVMSWCPYCNSTL